MSTKSNFLTMDNVEVLYFKNGAFADEPYMPPSFL